MLDLQNRLQVFEEYWVVIFGSWAQGTHSSQSDIDVAIISKNKNRRKNIQLLNSTFGIVEPIFDIHVFELLPLNIMADLMKKYVVIFGDPLEISEYFYYWRKLWKDQQKRFQENQCRSILELQKGIERRKRLQELNSRSVS